MSWEIREGDALTRLREMPDESVHCVVTSPPYWGLRDYGVEGQLGLESTPEEYTAALVGVFADVRRVLRSDGTLWLNLGDSYAAASGGGVGKNSAVVDRSAARLGIREGHMDRVKASGLKAKDLVGVPWRVFFALQADGWWLRSDIIWHKPNPMPESVTDRPTKAHEYVGLFAKSERYFYDAEAIKEPATDVGRVNGRDGRTEDPRARPPGANPRTLARLDWTECGRNKRSVWPIATTPYPEAHFATFPPELPELCIKAGTSEKGCCPECQAPWARVTERERNGDAWVNPKAEHEILNGPIGGGVGKNRLGPGISDRSVTTGWAPTCRHDFSTPMRCTVLDPFAGAGTTGLVATRLGRNFIGIELNPTYANMARKRIDADCPLFNRKPEDAA